MACRNFNKVLLTIETFHGGASCSNCSKNRGRCQREMLVTALKDGGFRKVISEQSVVNELESCTPQMVGWSRVYSLKRIGLCEGRTIFLRASDEGAFPSRHDCC